MPTPQLAQLLYRSQLNHIQLVLGGRFPSYREVDDGVIEGALSLASYLTVIYREVSSGIDHMEASALARLGRLLDTPNGEGLDYDGALPLWEYPDESITEDIHRLNCRALSRAVVE